MTLPFNSFSIHSLVGFIVTASLAVMFYLVYAAFGRRRLDLLAANFILCAAGICGAAFISDNLIPAGMPALGWANGPTAADLSRTTLEAQRFSWAFALFAMVSQLHFVLHYCDRRNWMLRHIRIFYAIVVITIGLVWTPFWMQARTAPMAETSSWTAASPWMPLIGWPAVPFMLIWDALVIYCTVMLSTNLRRPAEVSSEYTGQERLVMLAFLVQMVVTMIDLIFVMANFNGATVTPIGSTAMGMILAMALLKARIKAEQDKGKLMEERAELLETMNVRLLAAREEERRRVAKDLHDSVAQSLLSLQLCLRDGGEGTAGGATRLPTAELADRCKNLIQEIRGICHGLYPATLDLVGLAPSLAKLTDYCRAAGKVGRSHCDAGTKELRFSPDVEIAIFRVCQEAVSNAVRHSQASQIDIYLEYADGQLTLSVVDDGVGFDTADHARHGLGMNTMTDRIKGIGGKIEIESEPGQTRVDASVPCQPLAAGR